MSIVQNRIKTPNVAEIALEVFFIGTDVEDIG